MFNALNIEDHSRCVYDYVAVSLTVFHHGAKILCLNNIYNRNIYCDFGAVVSNCYEFIFERLNVHDSVDVKLL